MDVFAEMTRFSNISRPPRCSTADRFGRSGRGPVQEERRPSNSKAEESQVSGG